MADAQLDVVGVGNAIVDVIAKADEALIERLELSKGTMTLIDSDDADRLYGEMGAGIETSGGSAANTLAGIASLGGAGAYIGKVRDDKREYELRVVGGKVASFGEVGEYIEEDDGSDSDN